MKSSRSTVRGRAGRRGSVSVELALVLSFFFLPLVLGTVDFAYIMSARVQLNSALQAVELFAWANPDKAANGAAVARVANAGSRVVPITQAAPPTMSYTCLRSDGSRTPATITMNAGYSRSDLATSGASQGLGGQAVPSKAISIGNGMGTASCSSGFVQARATYTLRDKINLPLYLPGIGTHSTETITGTIWVR